MKEKFLQAIDEMRLISVTFDSKEKGIITRKCVPFDFGPSQKADAIDVSDKYHMLDLDTPEGKPHNLALKEEQIENIELFDETFNPENYVTWEPKWIYPRNWGSKS